MWCDESHAVVTKYGSEEWYMSSAGEEGFVVFFFLMLCL